MHNTKSANKYLYNGKELPNTTFHWREGFLVQGGHLVGGGLSFCEWYSGGGEDINRDVQWQRKLQRNN